MPLELNGQGQPVFPVSFTLEELNEVILLIDDKPVDEDFLRGIRRKMAARRKKFNRALRAHNQTILNQ